MKKGHLYHANPAPFAMVIANPKGRGKPRRAAKPRRNPAAAKRKAAVFVIRKPSRNPVPMKKSSRRRSAKQRRNPAMIGGPIRRKAGAKRWHHKKGTFVYNPPGAGKKRRVKAKRRKAVKRRNALSSFFSPNPMKTKKRRRGSRRRSRNPVARSGAKRRSGRRSSRRSYRRNPFPMVQDVFNSDILATTGGVLGGSVFANTVISKVAMPDATGAIPVKLWGVDYAPLASADPAVRLTFASKNALPLFFYKALIGGVTGAVLRRWSPRLGAGVIAGGVLAGATGFLQAQGLINAAGSLQSRGTGRVLYPGPGVGLLPGTSTRFTGPAQQFLRNGVPQSRGTGARVNGDTMPMMQAQSEGQFRGAN